MSGSQQDLEQRIRERAKALWEAEGRPQGRDEELWHRARALIETEDNPDSPDMVSTPPL